ncbi:hypothetical protein C9374_000632 [Naegleria lovaniensis]|uniref:Uncharacterized protein n=1 Tax=Naegleria lovaniensis TaxID=51637 RepID=A0AA88GZF7_NAELO|nr:uncharacterized protein C9374_000632 [Naegleria lovaniensis]KAG2388468.1 hypothetical protein C9374_000632 [Naegleria lovaniensis]
MSSLLDFGELDYVNPERETHPTSHNNKRENFNEFSNETAEGVGHQQQQQHDDDRGYFPPMSSGSYEGASSNPNETLFQFINQYMQDEEHYNHHENQDSSVVVIDVNEKAKQSLLNEKKKKKERAVVVDKVEYGSDGNHDSNEKTDYILTIYVKRLSIDLVTHIFSFLPVSTSTLLSKAFEKSFDSTNYRLLYQFVYNHFYSVQHDQVYKKLDTSWRETLLGLVLLQYREKEKVLDAKFPHASAKLSQPFGFIENNKLISMPSLDAYTTKKYKFTVITYEKYNTKDILTEFNKKNHSSILIDDVHTVQYEMNFVGYLIPSAHDFSLFAEVDAIILTYNVLDFNLFYTLSSWINLLEMVAPEIPVILVGTHANLRKNSHILSQLKDQKKYVMRAMDCVQLAKRFNILSYFEIDAFPHIGKDWSFASHKNDDDSPQESDCQLSTNQESTQQEEKEEYSSNHEQDAAIDETPHIDSINDILHLDKPSMSLIEMPPELSQQIYHIIRGSAIASHLFQKHHNSLYWNLWNATSSLYRECIPSTKCTLQ